MVRFTEQDFEDFEEDAWKYHSEDLRRLTEIMWNVVNKRARLFDDHGFHQMVYTCIG
jgi:hypothetical protein